jgi:hypothetical protein
MKKKHGHALDAAGALFTLFIFIALVMSLANTNVAAVAASMPSDMPVTGNVTSTPAHVAIWFLSLVLLVPLELSMRKKK